jgi:hypothetical protein
MTPRKAGARYSTRAVISSAITGNLIVALAKLGAARGPAAPQFSERAYLPSSIRDLRTRRGSAAPSPSVRDDPWGYGREIY